MIPFTIYDVATGRIRFCGSTSSLANVTGNVTHGLDVLMATYEDDLFYVVEGVAVARPVLTLPDVTLIADGAEQGIAVNVPVGTKVYRDFQLVGETEMSNENITIHATEPEVFELRFEPPFPFRPGTMKVEIHEAPL